VNRQPYAARALHRDHSWSQPCGCVLRRAMMEGYIAAKVIVEAVRRQGARPTREGTMAALDAMDSYDLGGYMVSYKPGQRVGSRFVELSIVSSSGRIGQ